MAAKNNATRTTCIKAKIANELQNRNNELCGNKEAMINIIMSKKNKLVQKEYKTKHN